MLLVDSGDLHDGESEKCSIVIVGAHSSVFPGTGLTDGFAAGGVDAHSVFS